MPPSSVGHRIAHGEREARAACGRLRRRRRARRSPRSAGWRSCGPAAAAAAAPARRSARAAPAGPSRRDSASAAAPLAGVRGVAAQLERTLVPAHDLAGIDQCAPDAGTRRVDHGRHRNGDHARTRPLPPRSDLNMMRAVARGKRRTLASGALNARSGPVAPSAPRLRTRADSSRRISKAMSGIWRISSFRLPPASSEQARALARHDRRAARLVVEDRHLAEVVHRGERAQRLLRRAGPGPGSTSTEPSSSRYSSPPGLALADDHLAGPKSRSSASWSTASS